jgi:DNA-binding CsgD family transcriptional regulator
VSLEKNRLIANLEYNYELEKKTRDNENLKQKNQIRKQQVIILSIFAFLLIVLVVVLYVLSRLRSKNFRNEQILLEKKKEMAEAKSELSEKEKIILENNLEIKNKELTSKTVELLHQIETMQSLAVRIESLKDSDSKSEIEEILHELKMKTRENVWDEFHTAFNSVHEGFYNKLLEYCPDLSSTEIKIAALLKLNLSTKEIAAISYKSESAVKTARHRLRNKLKLSPGEDLITFLMRI